MNIFFCFGLKLISLTMTDKEKNLKVLAAKERKALSALIRLSKKSMRKNIKAIFNDAAKILSLFIELRLINIERMIIMSKPVPKLMSGCVVTDTTAAACEYVKEITASPDESYYPPVIGLTLSKEETIIDIQNGSKAIVRPSKMNSKIHHAEK